MNKEMTYKELLEKHKKKQTSVDILGFGKCPRQATIVEVFNDWAVIRFNKDNSDESAPDGTRAVHFSVIVIEWY